MGLYSAAWVGTGAVSTLPEQMSRAVPAFTRQTVSGRVNTGAGGTEAAPYNDRLNIPRSKSLDPLLGPRPVEIQVPERSQRGPQSGPNQSQHRQKLHPTGNGGTALSKIADQRRK